MTQTHPQAKHQEPDLLHQRVFSDLLFPFLLWGVRIIAPLAQLHIHDTGFDEVTSHILQLQVQVCQSQQKLLVCLVLSDCWWNAERSRSLLAYQREFYFKKSTSCKNTMIWRHTRSATPTPTITSGCTRMNTNHVLKLSQLSSRL